MPWLATGLPAVERRWLMAILAVALAARLAAIGAIVAGNAPKHDDQFVGATSGDEAYAMSRALRTAHILRGSPTDNYDYFVAFDEYGRNSYVTALTAAQVVFGPTPYSLACSTRCCSRSAPCCCSASRATPLAPCPRSAAWSLVLFWPSLFVWSISLLKEPLYFLLGAIVLTAAIRLRARIRTWRTRMRRRRHRRRRRAAGPRSAAGRLAADRRGARRRRRGLSAHRVAAGR